MSSAAVTRRGDWCQTYTGRAFWLQDPRPEDIYAEDIAHALSNLCRFGGHSKWFYSVAEHSIHVSRIVPAALALRALLHDASEAYIVDVPRPLKRLLTSYAAIEERIQGAVYQRFGVPHAYSPIAPELDVITWADNTMLHTEALAMMAPPPQPWQTLPPPLPDFAFTYLGPVGAEWAFLARLAELT